jgi:hypothetical protein
MSGLDEFVPSEPIIFPTIRAGLVEGLESRQLGYSDLFFRHLTFAKRTLSAFIRQSDRQDHALVAGFWRSLCGIGEFSVRELDELIGTQDPAELHLSDDICRLLKAARAGHSPCQINGRAQLPAWYQRRHHPRKTANLHAALSYGRLKVPVLILDVSLGGCGLDQAPPLPIGAIVALTLESGRKLEGEVRWQNGARAGILFTSPLRFTDPLISAG